MQDIAGVLESFEAKGVRLWLEDGRVRYKAPKDALSVADLETLRASREQISVLLRREAGAASCAPLTYSQQQHWNLYELDKRPTFRFVAAALSLSGPLDVDALRRSLAENVRRQGGLRTRIVVCNGTPTQELAASGDWELKVEDLSAVSDGALKDEIQKRVEEAILKPIDIAVGPLFEVRLLRLRENRHVLIVVLDHIISDMASLNILLRDLFTGYVQGVRGEALSLPDVPVQLTDFALWQTREQDTWIRKHGGYWEEHLKGCGRLRFPEELRGADRGARGWGIVPASIGKELKLQLREWCRPRRTTLVMSVFAAYAALVLRWCGAAETVIQYQSNGRMNPQLVNTIGYVTAPLYLKVSLSGSDAFTDVLSRVTDEFCRAQEHADSSYMEAQLPRPEFTRNTAFNWVPQGTSLEIPMLNGSECALSCSEYPFEQPLFRNLERDTEPFILFFETEDAVSGGVYFPRNRFSEQTTQRFTRNFFRFLEALLRKPDQRIEDITLA